MVIRLDAEAYPGVDGLVRAVVLESAHRLKSEVVKTGEKILRFFSRLGRWTQPITQALYP